MLDLKCSIIRACIFGKILLEFQQSSLPCLSYLCKKSEVSKYFGILNVFNFEII